MFIIRTLLTSSVLLLRYSQRRGVGREGAQRVSANMAECTFLCSAEVIMSSGSTVRVRESDTYPAQLVGTLHTANLYVSILSSRDDLNTVKVTGQDHNVTP